MIFKFFNILFRLFLIFLICFVWVRYFVKDLTLSLVYTAILTACFELIIHFLLDRKFSKMKLKQEEEKLAEKISLNFIYNNKLALSYFFNLTSINYVSKKVGDYIEIKNKVENTENCNEKIVLFPFYSFSEISKQNVVEIMRKTKKSNPTKLIICGYKISKDAYELAKNFKEFKMVLLDSNLCFLKLIKPNNYYPENLKDFNTFEKTKFKDLLKAAISKKRAKGYFLASIVLLFSSFVVSLNIYYVIISSLLLILSLISFFFPLKTFNYDDNIL